ncbi:carbon-nitrogen hydrolase family protein [Algoriphagus vanfongensis]|uniref:carbon-nitrogen hydrolase family protein n=1 Tax=Algoriphagus vanfongensis TaxID=426371 RepID=UPI000424344D|nr:carbon-nitrogen hydrolase family protein [Algoriphagus vanfongensis]
MKISLAQINPISGNIPEKIELHKKWIEKAVSASSDLIIFPELSLTGYEPSLAKTLALDSDDSRLNIFQQLSDKHKIVIGVGLPTRSTRGILISLLFFQPQAKRLLYSKQQLHSDEKPFFIEGNQQLILEVKGKKIAPAICYESLQASHLRHAHDLGAEIYLASVAKSESGLKKAFDHFPEMAKQFQVPILMTNSIGFCDNFMSAGQSAVWNSSGELVSQLSADEEGLLTFDTIYSQITPI